MLSKTAEKLADSTVCTQKYFFTSYNCILKRFAFKFWHFVSFFLKKKRHESRL